MPHTPHTPGGASHPITPGGPPSVSSAHNEPIAGGGVTPNGSLNNNAASSSHNSPQTPGTPNNNRLSATNTNSIQDSQSHQEEIIHSLINSQTTGLVNLNESDLNAELNNFDSALENNESANDLNVC